MVGQQVPACLMTCRGGCHRQPLTPRGLGLPRGLSARVLCTGNDVWRSAMSMQPTGNLPCKAALVCMIHTQALWGTCPYRGGTTDGPDGEPDSCGMWAGVSEWVNGRVWAPNALVVVVAWVVVPSWLTAAAILLQHWLAWGCVIGCYGLLAAHTVLC